MSLIIYSRGTTLRTLGDIEGAAEAQRRGCEITGSLFSTAPNHRGLANDQLYCLKDRALKLTNEKDRAGAITALEDALEIAKETSRYAGGQIEFRAAEGATEYQRAYLQYWLDRDSESARITSEKALAIYAEIFAGKTTVLAAHDYLLALLTQYIGILENLESDEATKQARRAENAGRLNTVFKQFIECGQRLGAASTCGQVALLAARASGMRLNQVGRGGEGVEMLAATLPLADQYAADPFYARYSETFEQVGETRNQYGRALSFAGRHREAIDFLKTSIAWNKARYDEFDYDFYVRDRWFEAMKYLAEAYMAAGRTADARFAFKSCVGSYARNCYEDYAKILESGVGGPVDLEEARRVRGIKANTNIKRFTVPVSAKGAKLTVPFHLYVFERPPGWKYMGIEDQAVWLEKNRALIVPQAVRDSFIRLEQIAKDNNVSFPDLCIYATGAAKAETSESNTKGDNVPEPPDDKPQ